jgi:hypothetical protein
MIFGILIASSLMELMIHIALEVSTRGILNKNLI